MISFYFSATPTYEPYVCTILHFKILAACHSSTQRHRARQDLAGAFADCDTDNDGKLSAGALEPFLRTPANAKNKHGPNGYVSK